jgi:RNA polymerase sigma factor (sigma-70 family)
MTKSEFDKLVGELKAGENGALKNIFQENSKYCIGKLIFNFKCSSEDAEDIYTDAVLNFRDKIIKDRITIITDLRSYLYATCKNMLLVRFKKEKRIVAAAANLYEPMDNSEIEFDNENTLTYHEEIFKLTEKALTALPEKCQALLRAFYFDKNSLDEIAVKYNMANANVAKVTKSRCFQKLVKIIQNPKVLEGHAK